MLTHTHTQSCTHISKFASHFIEFRASMRPLLRRRGANYVRYRVLGRWFVTKHRACVCMKLPPLFRLCEGWMCAASGRRTATSAARQIGGVRASVCDMMTIFTRSRLDICKHSHDDGTKRHGTHAMMMLMRLMWRVVVAVVAVACPPAMPAMLYYSHNTRIVRRGQTAKRWPVNVRAFVCGDVPTGPGQYAQPSQTCGNVWRFAGGGNGGGDGGQRGDGWMLMLCTANASHVIVTLPGSHFVVGFRMARGASKQTRRKLCAQHAEGCRNSWCELVLRL